MAVSKFSQGRDIFLLTVLQFAVTAACCWVGTLFTRGLPVDGLPAMIMGMGNYKLSEFWKFVIPMYIITIVAMSIGAVVMFPM